MFCIVLGVLIIAGLIEGANSVVQMEEVYFSNQDDIEVTMGNGSRQVVFDRNEATWLETMDCKASSEDSRDRQIYWITRRTDSTLSGSIKRGFPDNNTMETVLSQDIHEPRGIAVDWSTGNIYFSQLVDNMGRLEVVSSDGVNRRILFFGLENGQVAKAVGGMAVNVRTGYLYFVNATKIVRCHLDGSFHETVVEEGMYDQFKSLSIDEETNTLFWTLHSLKKSFIKSMSIADFEANRENAVMRAQRVSCVHDVFVYNESMFLTVPSRSTFPDGCEGEGKVLMVRVPHLRWQEASISLESELLLTVDNNSFNPHGVCTFRNMSNMRNPCSDPDLCSSSFCFPVPDGHGSTRAKCGCSTGIRLNEENNMTCASVPEEFLLYARRFSKGVNGEVLRSEVRMIPLEGPSQSKFLDVLLPFDLSRKNVAHVAYDILLHKVYWTEASPPCIKRANLNGSSGVEVFINFSIAHPEGLAVDPYSGNLYWTDFRLGTISVTSLKNSTHTKTLFENVVEPQGLAVDFVRGFIYWTDVYLREPEVERATLDGRDRVRISAEYDDSISPNNVVVDLETGDVYWIKFYQRETRADIVRYTPSGEELVNLHGSALGNPFGLAFHNSYLYWTDNALSISRISRTASSPMVEHVDDAEHGVLGLVAVNNTGASMATLNAMCRAGACGQLCFQGPDISSEASCGCGDHLSLADDESSCQDPLPRLFVAYETSDSSGLSVVKEVNVKPNIIGSEKFAFSDMSEEVEIPLGSGVVKSLDADLSELMLYWVDGSDKTIKRRSLNSSGGVAGSEVIVGCCLWEPEDLAVDWLGQNLYWTDSGRNVIEVSRLNGTSRLVLVQLGSEYGSPGQIVVDPLQGYLYWGSKILLASDVLLRVYRIKMDGSQSEPTEVASLTEGRNASITGLTVDLSQRRAKVFYVVTTLDENNEYMYKVYSTASPTALYSGCCFSYDIRAVQGSLYGSSEKRPQPGLVNFNRRNSLYSSLRPLLQFVFLHHSIQPGKHICQVSSQCNGADSLCLVSDMFSRQCRCDARASISEEVLSKDSFNCATSHQFVVLATDELVYYLPYHEEEGRTSKVQRLVATPRGKLADVFYDPVNNSILWITNNSNHVNSAKLDNSAEWNIPLSSDPLQPFSMAYDWLGGHFFITERRGFELKMAVVNGPGRGTIVNLVNNRLPKPGQVFMDSRNSVLYYTIRDEKSDESIGIRRISLRDVMVPSEELHLNVTRFRKVTFDAEAQAFYWIRQGMDSEEGDVIEKYWISNSSTMVVASRASNVEALGAMTFQGLQQLFWYNRTDSYLYRYPGPRGPTRHLRWDLSNTTQVVKIVGFDRQTSIPTSTPCLSSQRPCSHLCVQESAMPTCHCLPHSTPEDGSNSVCMSDQNCESILKIPCGNDFSTCIPSNYYCDGIQHCSNNADEQNCSCTYPQLGCHSSKDHCYSSQQYCDGRTDCPKGEDEVSCCLQDYFFGCFVPGSNGRNVYTCLDNRTICDKVKDCIDGTDERDCAATTILPEATESPAGNKVSVTVAITLVIISVITIVVVVVIVVSVVRLVWKGRTNRRSHHSMTYPQHTPHDSNSDYSSDASHLTNTTAMSNYAHANNKPLGMTNQLHMINPPPSPISTQYRPQQHHVCRLSMPLSEDDNISSQSQAISEHAPPPPPCPSINYDNVSMNVSSVSQRGIPASIGAGGGVPFSAHHYYPQYHNHYNHQQQQQYPGGVVRQQQRRNPNPLLSNNHHHHHYVTFNGDVPYQDHDCSGEAAQCHQSSSHFYNLPPMYQRGRAPYSDISEQDSTSQLETESTLSVPPDACMYDVSMPHLPPPGRPPSPVTMCSEYHGQPPLSPQLSQRSSSTASFSSRD